MFVETMIMITFTIVYDYVFVFAFARVQRLTFLWGFVSIAADGNALFRVRTLEVRSACDLCVRVPSLKTMVVRIVFCYLVGE